jgi:hypothetical protein
MQPLQPQLESSYTQHPSFQFSAPALAADPAALEAFTVPYCTARDFGARLSRRQAADCQLQCERALESIFGGLRAQTDDTYEHRFLQELQAECVRLLRVELACFRAAGLRDSVELGSLQQQRDALQLQAQRCYFGQLPQPVVQEFLAIGAPEIARFRAHAQAGRVTRDDLSANSGPAVRAIMRGLNREFRALGVLDAVSAYAGSRMSVTGLALELSVPQATWWGNVFEALPRAPDTLYAHLDESIAHPKSIVYLTEVGEDNGPTGAYLHALESLGLHPLQEIIGRIIGNVGNAADSPLHAYYGKTYHQSMSSERFRRHFMRLPACLRFNSHLGWDVCPDSPLEDALRRGEHRMVGAAGTFIVFDGGRLLHRGGMVRSGERIALQVIFSNATQASRVLGRIKRALP